MPYYNALPHIVILAIYPLSIYEYQNKDIKKLAPTLNIYYIPSMQNAVAVNLFILHNGYLYLFQFTVSNRHNINDNFVSCFAQLLQKRPKNLKA